MAAISCAATLPTPSGPALTDPLLGVVQIGVGGMIGSIQWERVFRKGLDFMLDGLGPRQ